MLEDLKQEKSTIIFGDFGGGKTSLLLSAAQQEESKGFTVFLICCLDNGGNEDSVLNIALEKKYRNSGVQFISVPRMRRDLGQGRNVEVLDLIQQFMDANGDTNDVKVMATSIVYWVMGV